MRINEIFYSLQGEGHFSGKPAVFIRLAGCNLKCAFCDTQHEAATEMTDEEIVAHIGQWPARHVVVTGGEPSLQLTDKFVDLLHRHGYFVQTETNGTIRMPGNVDWITCSPKTPEIAYDSVDELKIVYDRNEDFIRRYSNVAAKDYRLQPCDTGNIDANRAITADCIDFIKANPKWSLSLQTHKLLDIR